MRPSGPLSRPPARPRQVPHASAVGICVQPHEMHATAPQGLRADPRRELPPVVSPDLYTSRRRIARRPPRRIGQEHWGVSVGCGSNRHRRTISSCDHCSCNPETTRHPAPSDSWSLGRKRSIFCGSIAFNHSLSVMLASLRVFACLFACILLQGNASLPACLRPG
jgi:hypothetical protein